MKWMTLKTKRYPKGKGRNVREGLKEVDAIVELDEVEGFDAFLEA